MAYDFSPYELEQIETKLPPQFATLKDKYPVAISNAAEDWDLKPLPSGYQPRTIDIYYADYAEPDLIIHNGELQSVNLNNPEADPSVIQMDVDGNWAYIQVEGKTILNRLGGVILPDVLVNHEVLMQSILKLS